MSHLETLLRETKLWSNGRKLHTTDIKTVEHFFCCLCTAEGSRSRSPPLSDTPFPSFTILLAIKTLYNSQAAIAGDRRTGDVVHIICDCNPSPLPLPFQERRRACSSAPYPKTQSAAAWGSSRSSSRWAATACCCSSPRRQVPAKTPFLFLI